MTRKYSLRITTLLVLAASMNLATSLFAAQPVTDQAQVVQAMRSMYVAATNDDLAKFHSVVAPGFYAFDGGERFNSDALMEIAKRLHAAGKILVWKVTEPEVHVAGDTAWITYVNKGSVRDSSGTRNLSWLESAVLTKQNGSWRIQFFHSTRVPSK
jgi:ketosteroid isomerase-like protein